MAAVRKATQAVQGLVRAGIKCERASAIPERNSSWISRCFATPASITPPRGEPEMVCAWRCPWGFAAPVKPALAAGLATASLLNPFMQAPAVLPANGARRAIPAEITAWP